MDLELRKEIEKLGGDEEDFLLLKNIKDPEDEVWKEPVGSTGKDEFNLSEFKKFYATLDFEGAKKNEISEIDVEIPEKPKKLEKVKTPAAPATTPLIQLPKPAPKVVSAPEVVNTVDEIDLDTARNQVEKAGPVKLRKSPLLKFGDENGTLWFECFDQVYANIKINEKFKTLKPLDLLVRKLKIRAAELIAHEASFGTGDGTRKFINTAATQGTSKDKAAALTLKIQENPVANHAVLEQLLKISKKKVRRDFVMCAGLLKDVLVSDLLPGDRRLYLFHERTSLLFWIAANINLPEANRALLLIIYEERLKQVFSEFISVMESAMGDPVDGMKIISLEITKTLLESQPEGESRLLQILVNKLGDPKAKVVNKSIALLTDLLRKHPNMQEVVAYEVESYLYRSGQSQTSIYSAISFLNQLVFSSDRHEVPSRLLNLYFEFFTSEVKKKPNKMSQKILLALLTGVNRAFPFAQRESGQDDSIEKNIDHMFKLVHYGTFIVALQSLSFLFQAFNTREELGDRFYNSMYKLLMRSEMPVETKRHSIMLNLIYRTMTGDKSVPRQKAFIKRLLSISLVSKAPLQAGALVLLGQLMMDKPQLRSISDNDYAETKSTVGGLEANKFLEQMDSDEEENFKDADKEAEPEKTKKKVGWVHRENKDGKAFDPWARNPSYCGADSEKSWELVSLSNHFHPSIAMFANNVLEGKEEIYPGDPLNDFTTIRFLDRFVYKNPKARDGKQENIHKRRVNRYLDTTQLPVSSLEFLQAKEKDLLPHDKFMQKYFKLRSAGGQKVTETNDEVDELEDISDNEFDEIMEEKEKGWENRVHEIDYSLATAKQRKAMKKRREAEQIDPELDDLDDEEPDLGDIYSDGSDDDEGWTNLGEEDEFSDGEMDEEPSAKKSKTASRQMTSADAEVFGLMMETQHVNEKQTKWEEGKNVNSKNIGKKFSKGKSKGKKPMRKKK